MGIMKIILNKCSASCWKFCSYLNILGTGTRPTNDISIAFEIRPKFAVLWFVMYSTNHDQILHTSRQCNCRDVCKNLLWSVEHALN